MLEGIDRVGRRATLEHQLGGYEASERGLQLLLSKAGDDAQQCVGELASDGGADLRDRPHRRQAVEPRHQRILQSGRNADRKSTRLNSSHMSISYAVFCLKKKKK